MAVYRQKHDGAMPLATGGWKGVFFCCFGKKSDTTTDTIKGNGTNHYGSTNKDEVDGEKKGSAYAYEEHESSSDSEDEDLKRFNQARNSRRSNSVRSAGSRRSKRSHKSELSHEPKDLLHGARKQRLAGNPLHSPMEPTGQHGRDLLTGDMYSPSEAASSRLSPCFSAENYPSPGARNTLGNPLHSPMEAYSPSVGKLISPAASPSEPRGPLMEDDEDRLTPAYSPSDNNSFIGIDKGVIATEHEEVKQYDNQAYQLDTPSNIGSTEEHLFDVSDLTHDPDAQLISKCGQLEVTFNYQQENCKMHITVNHAKDIPSKDRGGANSTQIRLLLLPTKKQRHKTKIKTGEHPVFEETFTFKVPPDAVGEMGIRMRLYGCERMRRERMIGESVVGFASLNLEQATTHLLTLEPRANISPPKTNLNHGDSKLDVSSLSRSDSASSSQSMQHGGMPELLVGLAYNGTTGRLSVEVIKGSNFRNMAMQRAPDTYVKLTLMSANGQEIARSKTSIRRGQPNPLYKETFMFQVALFQLPDVTLMVSVYNKRSMKRKEMIGWFSSGLNSSGEEELSHWKDMVDSKGEQVCRWHVLLEA